MYTLALSFFGYTVSNFVQYVVTIAKLNLCLYTIFMPPSNNPAPHPPYKRRMPNVTAYVFLINSST